MDTIRDKYLETQLTERRSRLTQAITKTPQNLELKNLLRDVDAALGRMGNGTYGICETCHDPIESDRLLVDPLIRYCIDHLSLSEQRSLERDLVLASQIQRTLLPKKDIQIKGWSIDYHYLPAGPVSGDYCDVMTSDPKNEAFYFLLGDVSGKGVAASMLMTHLHATFRTLIATNIPPDRLMQHANKIFCEGTMTSHFATLVFGVVTEGRNVEIYNAGHCLPILVHAGNVSTIPSTGLPLGLFCEVDYPSIKFTMANRDSLVLYTDGLTEAGNSNKEQYGEDRLMEVVRKQNRLNPDELIQVCIKDMISFRNGVPQADDVTMMVIQRTG